MNCNFNCKNENSICKKAIYSTGVSVVTVSGTDTLVIDIPQSTYFDGCRYCLFVIQSIPTAATINMPVAVSIGGVTTTVYPLVRCDCAQVTACAIRARKRYSVRVSTTGNGGVFKVLSGLSCAPNNALSSIPVATTTPPAAPAQANVARETKTAAKTSSKEVNV